MRILSSSQFYNVNTQIKTTETPVDITYLSNLAIGQEMYKQQDWLFYKLMKQDRKFIKQMTVMMSEDLIVGLAIIWDFGNREIQRGHVESLERLAELNLLQYGIGVYVNPEYLGMGIGSFIVNCASNGFNQPIFCRGNEEYQQKFWSSYHVDKTFLEYMLIEHDTVKIIF